MRSLEDEREEAVKTIIDTFNEKLLIETRRIEGSLKEVLHMTDMWSRLTILFMERTTPDVLAKTIRELWTTEFGIPKMIMGEDSSRITTGEIARILRLFEVNYLRLIDANGRTKPLRNGRTRTSHGRPDNERHA